jgi:hypothetical protein
MQYPDDDKISPSTIAPIQYKASSKQHGLICSWPHALTAHDTTYTKGELRAITPEHVLLWMNMKAFGVTDLSTDAYPILVRSSVACLLGKSDIVFHA